MWRKLVLMAPTAVALMTDERMSSDVYHLIYLYGVQQLVFGAPSVPGPAHIMQGGMNRRHDDDVRYEIGWSTH